MAVSGAGQGATSGYTLEGPVGPLNRQLRRGFTYEPPPNFNVAKDGLDTIIAAVAFDSGSIIDQSKESLIDPSLWNLGVLDSASLVITSQRNWAVQTSTPFQTIFFRFKALFYFN